MGNKPQGQKGAWRRAPGSRGNPLPRVHPRLWVGPALVPVAPLQPPFGVLLTLDLKTLGVSKRNFFAASLRRKPDREKKSSGREKAAGEFPSRRWQSPPSSSPSRRASSGSSHQHHLHHQHRRHPISSRCNNCHCVAISSSESYAGR